MYLRQLFPDEISLIPSILLDVFNLYEQSGFEIYLVGGGVRNLILGKSPVNCDLTTNATPEQSLEVLSQYQPFYNNDFGTVSFNTKVNGQEELYEITTYRSEKGYSDFRRPDNLSWGQTLEEDIVRRDFTINAIAVGRRGGVFELIDLVSGLADFENGLIRAVGDAEQRFQEDALRMMRAIRFASKLGFTIESATLSAISAKAPLLKNISHERIRDEFLKILSSNYPADGVRLLISTGLINQFLPELLEGRGVLQGGHHHLTVLDHLLECLRNCPSPDPIIRLATLIHDIGKPRSQRFKCRRCGRMFRDLVDDQTTCINCGFAQPVRGMITFYGHEVIGARMAKEISERLRLTRSQINKIETLVRWHMFAYQPNMTDAAIRRLIRKVGKENISDLILLRISDRKGSGANTTSWRFLELQKRIGEQLFEPMEVNDLVINGRDVMSILGIPPGPKVGLILRQLFDEVLEDTSKNTSDYLLSRTKEIANQVN